MLENQIFGLFQELGPDDDVALLMGGLGRSDVVTGGPLEGKGPGVRLGST